MTTQARRKRPAKVPPNANIRYEAEWWPSLVAMRREVATFGYFTNLEDALFVGNTHDLNNQCRAFKQERDPVTYRWRTTARYNHDGEQFDEIGEIE